jgi:hypothetical protein
MNEATKTLLRPLSSARSVVLVVSLYNFLLIYRIANRWSLDCMICPWYSEWSFSNAPSLILLAAIALRFGRRAGSFLALVAGGVIVVRGLELNFELMRHGEWLESWSPLVVFQMNPFLSLHTQYLFALVIFHHVGVDGEKGSSTRRHPTSPWSGLAITVLYL